MSPSPLISIITVTYNVENEIERTLNSIKQQSFTNFEHLIIDGDSKDKTLAIVKANVITNSSIVSEPDKGLYDAMNKGLGLAKGKYVIFLNAGDTFFNSNTLEHYADAAGENYDIIYGDTVIVDDKDKIISRRHLNVPEKLEFKSFSKGMLICHQAFMVKKQLTEPYDLKYHFSADYDWCVKCIKKSSPEKCFNLNTDTIRYLSDGLTDKNKIKSLKERFQIMCNHYGVASTLKNHMFFVFRSLKRGSL